MKTPRDWNKDEGGGLGKIGIERTRGMCIINREAG